MGDKTTTKKRCATVAVIGRPSSGKSTFINAATGQKVSIVSAVPQTTRNTVRGIVNSERGQLVFIDTPGCHRSEKKMNQRLHALSKSTLEYSDALVYLIDAGRKPGYEEEDIAVMLKNFQEKTIVVINKIDLQKTFDANIFSFLETRLQNIQARNIYRVSALTGEHITTVCHALYGIAPDTPPLYPEDYYTDQQVDFRIKEIIREQAINRVYDEIPHAIYIEISDMEMNPAGNELFVRAFLYVEQESQKGIVIGKDASIIKAIRIESIKALRKILPYRVRLDLRVKVRKNWQKNDAILNSLIN
jgi:GTP-binding protein Era